MKTALWCLNFNPKIKKKFLVQNRNRKIEDKKCHKLLNQEREREREREKEIQSKKRDKESEKERNWMREIEKE